MPTPPKRRSRPSSRRSSQRSTWSLGGEWLTLSNGEPACDSARSLRFLDTKPGVKHSGVSKSISSAPGLCISAALPDIGDSCSALAQYVALPPDASNTAPVAKLHSSEHSQAISAATSSTLPTRPIGMRETMYSSCSGVA